MYACMHVYNMYVRMTGTVRELDSPTEEKVGAFRIARDLLCSLLNGPPTDLKLLRADLT